MSEEVKHYFRGKRVALSLQTVKEKRSELCAGCVCNDAYRCHSKLITPPLEPGETCTNYTVWKEVEETNGNVSQDNKNPAKRRYKREIGVIFEAPYGSKVFASVKALSEFMTGKDLSMTTRDRHKGTFNKRRLSGKPKIEKIFRYTTSGAREEY